MKFVLLYCLLIVVGSGIGYLLFLASVHLSPSPIIISPTASQSASISSFFSIAQAPHLSIKGSVTQLNGNVEWESRSATNASILNYRQIILQGEKIMTSKLADVSIQFDSYANIDISEQTNVDIIQTLPVNFVFQQQNGSATYSALHVTPVSVRSYRLLTSLIEGKVNIMVNENARIVTVNALEGNVTVAYNNPELISQVIVLNKGDSFIFDSDTRRGRVEYN